MLGRSKRPPAAAENPLTSTAPVPTLEQQRERLIARYTQQFIETAIAIPDVLAQDRKDIRKHWQDRGMKAPEIDPETGRARLDANGRPVLVEIDKGQIDYDVGTILAQRARLLANGIVDQVLPLPKRASSNGSAAAPVDPTTQHVAGCAKLRGRACDCGAEV